MVAPVPLYQIDNAGTITGPVSANDHCIVFRPGRKNARSPGVILLHGAGNDGTSWQSISTFAEIPGRLGHQGCTSVAVDLGDVTLVTGDGSAQQSWGRPSIITRLEAWRAWLDNEANNPGVVASKVVIVAHSMGCYNALAYARDFPSKVAGLVLFNPFIDIITMRANRTDPTYGANWGPLATAFDTSWGLTQSDPVPAGVDLFSDTLTGVKTLMYYCTNDPFIPTSWVTNMQAHIGASAQIVNAGALGHFAFAACSGYIPAVNPERYMSFVLECMASAV